MKLVISFGILFLSINMAYSQESRILNDRPYIFGSACQSQGNWTAEAVQASSNLQNIIQQIKDDPNCNSLSKKLESYFGQIGEQTKVFQQNATDGEHLKQVADQGLTLSALTKAGHAASTLFFGTGRLKNQIVSLLMQNVLEGSMTNSELKSPQARESAASLYSVGKQLAYSANTTLDIATNVMDSLLTEQQCVTGNIAGPVLSSMVSIVSSLVSSRQNGFGNRVASFINKLSQFKRNKDFVKSLRTLNDAQFRNSVSCLIEVSSENYCNVTDAQVLYNSFIEQNKISTDQNGNYVATKNKNASSYSESALRGLYILTQQIPVVTEWLEKVMRGVEPILKTDAQQKNDTMQTTMQFFLKENILNAAINSQAITLSSIKELEAQKKFVIRSIGDLTDIIVGGAGPLQVADTNFYLTASTAIAIPFKLIGVKVPDRVAGNIDSGFAQDYAVYLQSETASYLFKNPVDTFQTIKRNLKNLINNARGYAIAYYNKWYIYDQPGLFVDAISGVRFSVREVFQNIMGYLDDMDRQYRNSDVNNFAKDRDLALLPTIALTRESVKKVLAQFDKVTALGNQMKSERDVEKLKLLTKNATELHVELIQTIYDEFKVYVARSGFIAGRLNSIVNADMQNLIRTINEKPGFSVNDKLLQQVFLATNLTAFENMRLMSGGVPANIKNDLANAKTLHERNLMALEETFGPYFANYIAQFNYNLKYYNQLRTDNLPPTQENNLPKTSFKQKIFGSLNSLVELRRGNDFVMKNASFDSLSHMHRLYCIQSLAFNDWRNYQKNCTGVVLTSDFNLSELSQQDQNNFESLMNANYDKILSSQLENRDSLSEKERSNALSGNTQDRICAFRQYSRNNLIMYLTLGRNNSHQ